MNTRLKTLLPLFTCLAIAALAMSSLATTTTSITVARRDGQTTSYPVAATTKTLMGTFAALDGSNNLVNATDAAARRVVGLHAQQSDNSAGNAGDISSSVHKGLFLVANSTINALTAANIGHACFIEDNNTVASSGGTNYIVAGIVDEVTTAGVWIWVGLPYNRGVAPVTVSMTSTNGTAAAASASLSNLAAEAENIGDDVRAIKAALILHGLLR